MTPGISGAARRYSIVRRWLSPLALVLSLAGLAGSAASLHDYLAAAPGFCAETGCASVRASAWSHPLGVPMPALGVAYFLAMVALAFVPRPRLYRALAIAGGAWAIALVVVQAVAIGAWCRLCLVVDPVAIALAVVVAAGAGTVRPRRGAAVIAAATVVAGALAVAWPRQAPPPAIAADDSADVVEYVDFECPFCRALDPVVRAAIARAPAPVRVVRRMVPLPQHAHAMVAALAWCCADAQGKGDAMAAALFAADPDELTVDGCAHLAAGVGCDMGRYHAELAGPAIRARIAGDRVAARRAHVAVLPTVIVRGTPFAGADHSVDELVAALAQAATRRIP